MKSAFPPIVNENSKILILGSMPGEKSLQAQEYYAFRQNAFWKIMISLLEIPEETKYKVRIKKLQQNGIALWDVIERCERVGSLDSKIDHSTVVANDFSAFLKKYPGIEKIFFNGKSVEALFKRHVQKKQALPNNLVLATLPSTSPANASLTFEKKLEVWRVILNG